MNYEKRFLEIRDFLKEHQYLHELEMLERYESPLIWPYNEWSDELNSLTTQEILEIENTNNPDLVKNSDLRNFIIKINKLIELPAKKIKELHFSEDLKRKMNKKKVHEIGLINSLLKNEKVSGFIDIGSGAGHLSSVLVNDSRTSICIDLNSEFQKMGLEKLKRWSPATVDKIRFIQFNIKSPKDLEQFGSPNDMTLGLHSCGPLSTQIVKLRSRRMLNFACCYHKLHDEYNISMLASSNPIWFTKHALTSAAKGFAIQSSDEFDQKLRVKKFRYTLHFFLKKNYKQEFLSVGNAKSFDYEGEFSDYCHKYSPITINESKEEILNYYNENKTFIQQIIVSGSLRALIGRVIEVYIILDRAIYLQEHNLEPKVFELFDREISPRNIALFV